MKHMKSPITSRKIRMKYWWNIKQDMLRHQELACNPTVLCGKKFN